MKETSSEGDPKTAWLMHHEPWLLMLARWEIDSRFHGKFSASDAVQQTLLAAWNDWDACRADDDRQRLAWLRRILAHQLAHLARHYGGTQKRDVAREVSLERSLVESSQRLDQWLEASISTPSQFAAKEEEKRRLVSVLNRLPDDYRQVLTLRHLEGLGHDQIAKRMDRSPGAARMLWVRALTRLKSAMQDRPGDA